MIGLTLSVKDRLALDRMARDLTPAKAARAEREALMVGGRSLRTAQRKFVNSQLGHSLKHYHKSVMYSGLVADPDGDGNKAFLIRTKERRLNARFAKVQEVNAKGTRKSKRNAHDFETKGVWIRTFKKKRLYVPGGRVLSSGKVVKERRRGNQTKIKGVYMPGPYDVMTTPEGEMVMTAIAGTAIEKSRARLEHNFHRALATKR